MTVSIAFAVIGGVIFIGFLANILFRVTKIPSALLLIAIGVVLGPVTGWMPSASLMDIAPIFGTVALLIILFEGGLELDIGSVIREAPKATLLAVLVFAFSFGTVLAFALFLLHMSMFHSLLLAGILSAASPAICLPMISGLSVRKEIQTLLKLESTLADVLLIVTVVLILDFQTAGSHGSMGMVSRFVVSFAVAFLIAVVAGVLWARLIGWMGREPLAYMLTLGFVFLLYVSVEELGGSAAIAVLLFGIMLENMQRIAGRAGGRVRYLFGIDIRAEQFVLNEFMKNITEEISFLVRTFFFVYLGLIIDFKNITPGIALSSVGIVALLLVGRGLGVWCIRKPGRLTAGEMGTVVALLPRGLTTAVMAFLPAQYGIAGTGLLPVYAFTVIILTNVLMTVGIFAGERRLASERAAAGGPAEAPLPVAEAGMAAGSVPDSPMDVPAPAPAGEVVPEEPQEDLPGSVAPESAPPPSFTWRMSQFLGIRPADRKYFYIEAIRASSLAHAQFWVLIFFAAALTVLGLILNQSAIVIGAALIVPIAWPVVAAGFALTIGDVYFFFKLLLKLALAAALIVALSSAFGGLLPFNAVNAEIASRTRATILDFLVAFFAGMAGAAMLFSRKRTLQFLPGTILGVTLLPPLAVMGFGLGSGLHVDIFQGAAILFTSNFFAAVLGASWIFALAGMPSVAGLKSIRTFKRRELNKPVVKTIFRRLGLQDLAEGTGSVRSRILMAAVFLLALVIPLQMAFNQLSMEFRARQAVSELEKIFEVPGRSAIINSASSIGEDAIVVRIQVATNAFFTSSDIRRFEERVSDRTGKAARLDLVQSLSDVGEGEKIRGILSQTVPSPAEYLPGIPELTIGLSNELEKSLRAVPMPRSVTILGASAGLGPGGQAATFRIDYLADEALSEDASSILTQMLERQMKLGAGTIRLAHVPARYSVRLDANGRVSAADAPQLLATADLLRQFPRLHAEIAWPGPGGEAQADRALPALRAIAPILGDPARMSFLPEPSPEARTAILNLRPDPASGSGRFIGPLP